MVMEMNNSQYRFLKWLVSISNKNKKMNTAEFDDDFLGGQGPLTSDEEKALSEYLKNRKIISRNSSLDHPVIKKKPKMKVWHHR